LSDALSTLTTLKTMELLRMGNRLINPDLITHVSYERETKIGRECVVSFGCDDCVIFYNDEADVVWAFLSLHCRNFTPRSNVAT